MKPFQTVTTTLLCCALGFCFTGVLFLQAKVKQLEAELNTVVEYLSKQQKRDNHLHRPEIQNLFWEEQVVTTTIEALQAFLDQFNSADSVFRYCKEHGIKGRRGNFSSCPLVYAVRKQFPDLTGVVVDGHQVGGFTGGNVSRQWLVASTSVSLKDFIGCFDIGHYPELEIEEPMPGSLTWSVI